MTSIPSDVEATFATYPDRIRDKLLSIRDMIMSAAKDTNVGALTETLKWGQPAYLTAPKTGSTIRLGWSSKHPDRASVFFICHTHLVDRFREIYPDSFNYVDNRELFFHETDTIPETELGHCLAMALTYHRNKS